MKEKKTKLTNRLLALVMVIVLGLSMFPAKMASAEDNGTVNGEVAGGEGSGSLDGSGGSADNGAVTGSGYTFTLVDSDGSCLSGVEVSYSITGKITVNAAQETEIASDTVETDENGEFSLDFSAYSEVISGENPFTITYSFTSNGYTVNKVSEQITSATGTHILAAAYAISISGTDTSNESVEGTYTYCEDGASEGVAFTGGSLSVANGSSGEIKIKAPDGYRISAITTQSGSSDPVSETVGDSDTEYTITVNTIAAALSISVVYQKTYTVSVVYMDDSASGQYATVKLNNNITATDSITVDSGEDVSVNIVAPENYWISEYGADTQETVDSLAWTSDSCTECAGTLTDIESDIQIEIQLSQIEYVVTVLFDGETGKMTMLDSYDTETSLSSGQIETIYSGNSYTFYATPDSNYRVKDVTVTNVDTNETMVDESYSVNDYVWSYSLSKAQASYEISVTFALNEYEITTITNGETGNVCTVTTESEKVEYNGTASVTLEWENGYYIENLTVLNDDGEEVSYSAAEYEEGSKKLKVSVSNVTIGLSFTATYAKAPSVDATSYTMTDALRTDNEVMDGSIVYVYANGATAQVALSDAAENIAGYAYISINSFAADDDLYSEQNITADTTISSLYFGGYFGVFSNLVYWSCFEPASDMVLIFDETDPQTAEITVDGDSETDGTGTVYYSGDAEITVSAEETEEIYSGLASVVYWLDNTSEPETTTVLYTYTDGDTPVSSTEKLSEDVQEKLTFTITNDNADHTLYVKVTDRAGNSSVASTEVNFCATSITVSMSGSKSAEAAEGYYYNTERTVSITVTEREDLFNPDGLTVTTESGTVELSADDFSCDDGEATSMDGVMEYTFTCTFADEGEYNWSFTYENEVGFAYSSSSLSDDVVSGSDVFDFIYDKTAPGGYVTIDSMAFQNEDITGGYYISPLSTLSFAYFAQQISSANVETSDQLTDENIAVSGVNTEKTLYYKSTGTAVLSVSDLETLYAENSSSFSSSLYLTDIENETFVIYARIVDQAGNVSWVSSDGAIVDNLVPIVTIEPAENKSIHAESNVELEVTIEDPADTEYSSFSGIDTDSVVYWISYFNTQTGETELKPATVTTDENTELISVMTASITLNGKQYDYSNVVVYVQATDNAGNQTVSKYGLDIDVLEPTISVEYEDEGNNNGNGYYAAARTATITVTERDEHFDYTLVPISITATGAEDAQSTEDTGLDLSTVLEIYGVSNESSGNRGYTELTYTDTDDVNDLDAGCWTVIDETIYVNGWMLTSAQDPNNDTHKIQIVYTGDANYTFTMSATDLAGNVNEEISYEDTESSNNEIFTVDTTAPTGSISLNRWENLWESLLKEITFGRYSQETVTVTLEASDETSPIILQYYVTSGSSGATALSDDDLNALDLQTDAWVTVDNEDKLSILCETIEQADDDQLVVYMRVKDYAGNAAYISTNGYVIDDTAPEITVTALPESDYTGSDRGTIDGYYNSKSAKGIEVTVEVSDIDETGSYSGLSEVYYVITADGVDTKKETLFSFEDENSNFENPSYDDLVASLTGDDALTFTIDTGEFNRCDVNVTIYAVDNAGNEAIVVSKDLDIDVTAPAISVSYKDEGDNNGNGYYAAARTATIMVTERDEHFDYTLVPITITAEAAETAEDETDSSLDLSKLLVISNNISDETAAFKYVSYGEGEDIADLSELESGCWTVKDGIIYVNGWTLSSANDPNKDTHTIYIKYSGDANYTFSISAADTAENQNNGITYADTESNYNEAFTVDKTAPTGSITIDEDSTWINKLLSIITFGIIKNNSVSVEITGSDETSPITLEYYVQRQTEGTLDGTVMSEDALDALADSVWTTVGNEDNVSSLDTSWTEEDNQFVVYIRITDDAGNVTYIGSNGAISDTDSPTIELTPENANVNNGVSGIYGYYNCSNDGIVNVDVDITDVKNNSYSGLETVTYQVLCDDVVTQSGTLFSFNDDVTSSDPTYAQLAEYNTYSGTIEVNASKNNSCDVKVIVTAVDQAGNSSEETVSLDIDVTAPTIAISYDNNSAENSRYFDDTRTATIVITERTDHFDSDDVNITITAVDADGNTVSGATVSSMLSSWTTVEGSTADAATHTATITYSKDANYTFAISYTDKAGNTAGTPDTGSSVAPYKFTVDTTAPTGTVTYTSAEGNTDTKSSLIKKLTFGFYSSSKITVSGTSDDVTSPIASVKYYKTSSTTAMTTSQLDALSSSSWKTFSGFSISSDEQFTVYIKITDNAGNYTYISTDGLIVDKTRPVEETLAPEITLTQPVNDIYSGNVNVDVTVTDPTSGSTYSGLKSVTYEVYNLGELTQSGTLYTFSNTSPTASQLKQSISDVIQVLSSLNNSNDVEIVVYAEDNAGNTSQKSVTCMIDTTAPTISVSYDNNSPDSSNTEYFKENRTATITITERNFDANDVIVTITNTDGTIPTISGWTKNSGSGNEDDTTWTATILYSADGDYTFAIEYTDEAGNKAGAASYAAGTVAGEEFTIDKTIPTVAVSYNNNDVLNGNYYKASRTATITITEHNFDASRVTLTATANGTSMTVNPSWSTSGDVHTATVTFDSDALYTFDVAYTDMAGNDSADYSQDTFYVDLTNPEISITGVEDGTANTGEVEPVITVTDTNYNSNGVVITLEGLRFGKEYNYSIEDITDGQKFTFENIEQDDIYVLTVTATDKAGNVSTDSIRFSVNRDGSTYDITALEAINRSYIQSENMMDLVIVEVNPNALSNIVITVYKNGEAIILTEGVDYEIDHIHDEEGDGWHYYTYTIFKKVFEEDGTYSIKISSVDEAENPSENVLNTEWEIEFIIDNTDPTIIITNVEENKSYNAEIYEVILAINDNMALSKIVVMLDGKEWMTWEGDGLQEVLDENGDFVFEVPESTSARTFTVTVEDAAGNTISAGVDRFWVTTNAWVRFYTNTPLLIGTIVGLIVLIGLIIFLILFVKRKKKKEEETV